MVEDNMLTYMEWQTCVAKKPGDHGKLAMTNPNPTLTLP